MGLEPPRELRLLLRGPEATLALGEALGRRAHPGLVLTLEGELGTGKTSLVRGLAKGLDIEEPISSPTFTLMNDYLGRLPLYHFDAWMEGRERSFLADGGAEVIGSEGVCAVEWGERVEEQLPEPRLHVYLAHRGLEARLLQLAVVGEGPGADALEQLLRTLEAIPDLREEER